MGYDVQRERRPVEGGLPPPHPVDRIGSDGQTERSEGGLRSAREECRKRRLILGGFAAALLVAAALVVGLLLQRRHKQRQLELGRHTWVVTMIFEDGREERLYLDARKPVEELTETVSQAIEPMFADLTPPESGYRTLGRLQADRKYTFDRQDNEGVRELKSLAAEKGKKIDVKVTAVFDLSLPYHSIRLTSSGEFDLAEGSKEGSVLCVNRGLSMSKARQWTAENVAGEIVNLHKYFFPIMSGEKSAVE